jgi:hypothetical protein
MEHVRHRRSLPRLPPPVDFNAVPLVRPLVATLQLVCALLTQYGSCKRTSGGRAARRASHDSVSLGRFRLCFANAVCKLPCAGARRQRFKRQVGFGKEHQGLVSASATGKHPSCCRCAKRRPGIRDRDRPLPSSRPLVHSPCDHTTRSRLADGEAGKIPWVGFYGDRICGTSRSDQVAMENRGCRERSKRI